MTTGFVALPAIRERAGRFTSYFETTQKYWNLVPASASPAALHPPVSFGVNGKLAILRCNLNWLVVAFPRRTADRRHQTTAHRSGSAPASATGRRSETLRRGKQRRNRIDLLDRRLTKSPARPLMVRLTDVSRRKYYGGYAKTLAGTTV
jgi:hypothetical protein